MKLVNIISFSRLFSTYLPIFFVISPDGKYVASGSHTGQIALYSTETGKKEETLDAR